MTKLAIYPYSDRSFPLLEFLPQFRPELEISDLVSPVGSGFAGHDAAWAANRQETGTPVHSDIDRALERCDALFVPFGDLKKDLFFQDAYEIMVQAAKMGKAIFCGPRLTAAQRKELKGLSSEFHDGFKENINYHNRIVYGAYKPAAPVVFVHNLNIEADSFEITLALAQRFRRDGYRVSVVGDRPEYNFLGLNGSSLLLEFFYGNETLKNLPKAIQLFQHYLHAVETDQEPDVILLNFPGGATSTRDFYPNESGAFTYIMSQIARPDYAVVCAPYSDLDKGQLAAVHNGLKARFGAGLDMVHFSNRQLHPESTRHTQKEEYLFLPDREVIENVQQLQKSLDGAFPVFCGLTDEGKEGLYQALLEKMAQE